MATTLERVKPRAPEREALRCRQCGKRLDAGRSELCAGCEATQAQWQRDHEQSNARVFAREQAKGEDLCRQCGDRIDRAELELYAAREAEGGLCLGCIEDQGDDEDEGERPTLNPWRKRWAQPRNRSRGSG